MFALGEGGFGVIFLFAVDHKKFASVDVVNDLVQNVGRKTREVVMAGSSLFQTLRGLRRN